MATCTNCNGDMLGDGYTEIAHCEYADEESYYYKAPDDSPVYCTEHLFLLPPN